MTLVERVSVNATASLQGAVDTMGQVRAALTAIMDHVEPDSVALGLAGMTFYMLDVVGSDLEAVIASLQNNVEEEAKQ